jgi:SMI1-KNR4 cell-wall
MSLVALRKVLPISTVPSEIERVGDWNRVERILGTRLPPDYKDYIDAYGSAMIIWLHDLYIIPYNPFSDLPHRNLLQQLDPELAVLREVKSWRESFAFPIYPEPQGLLPWGTSGDGDKLYWQMIGEPMDWPVVVMETRWGPVEQFAESMTSFLTRLLSGTLESQIWRNYEPPEADEEDLP